MQTFLPYPDFEQSAKCLDNRRLGKQRVEVLQLLIALTSGPIQYFDPIRANWFGYNGEYSDPSRDHGDNYFHWTMSRATPWYNHPAAKMWRGYEQALTDYGLAIINEWVARGYNDTCHDKICDIVSIWSEDWNGNGAVNFPPWFGNDDFHAAHRSNLLRKDPVWYGQFGWTEPNDLPYIWPEV